MNRAETTRWNRIRTLQSQIRAAQRTASRLMDDAIPDEIKDAQVTFNHLDRALIPAIRLRQRQRDVMEALDIDIDGYAPRARRISSIRGLPGPNPAPAGQPPKHLNSRERKAQKDFRNSINRAGDLAERPFVSTS